MLDEFDQEVGLHYLRAIHLNDSKGTSRTSTPHLSPAKTRRVGSPSHGPSLTLSAPPQPFAGKLGCNLDRHEDIGKGCIGIAAFRDIVNEPRLANLPMILETPGR